MRILIVEDEVSLANTLATGMRRRGMAVDVSTDGRDGCEKALVTDYDVVVLDRDLPGLHGDDVCRSLRAAARPARILMLTAAASTDDLVAGFELGADDYLGKPFAFVELVARVTALARRSSIATPTVVRVGDLRVDVARRVAERAGTEVALTAREFDVLDYLVRVDGRVVGAEELLEHVWDEHADPFTASVRVILSRLRNKLGAPSPIETVVGKGYRLNGERRWGE